MSLGISSSANNIISWNVTETTSPTAPGGTIVGTGSASVNVFYTGDNQPIDESGSPIDVEFIQGEKVFFQVEPLGYYEGFAENSSFHGSPGQNTSASINLITLMSQLSVQRDVPPVMQTKPADIFLTYINTVLDLPGNMVNYIGSDDNEYSFIGWTGDVWQGLCSFASMINCEIATDGAGIEIRDIGERVVDFSNRTAPTQTFHSNNLGRYIDVTYQNQTVISTILANTTNEVPNPSVESNISGYGPQVISHPNVITNDGRSSLWSAQGDYSYMVEYECSEHVTTTQTARAYTPVISHTGGDPLFVSLAANMTSSKPARYSPSGVYTMRLRLFDASDTLIATHTATAALRQRATISLSSTPLNVAKFQTDVSKDWIWNN